MPKWGLTDIQRRTKPWGIDREWLEPAKTITDPVHNDIYLTRLETALIDSPPMQRLRAVRQLGTAHLVYPGAVHSRFSHSIGTLRAAQDLIDAVVDGLSGPRAGDAPSLLAEWRVEAQPVPLQEDAAADLTGAPTSSSTAVATTFDRKLAEATVLARLGGLLHDICHVPMGHTVEDDLDILEPHDGNAERFDKMWSQIPQELRMAMGEDLAKELRPLILSKEKDTNGEPVFKTEQSRYPFVTDIVGNTICADLMDYLRRDHLYCGLPFDVGSRFVDNFYVTSNAERIRPQRMAITVSRAGHVRHDILTELGKYLRYRYELSERVLYHHAKVAADAMVGKLLDMWKDALWVDGALAAHDGTSIIEQAGDVTKVRDVVVAAAGEAAAHALDVDVRDQIESTFLSWGDDGLLTWIRNEAADRAGAGAAGHSRYQAIASLAGMISNRNLFKAIGKADSGADQAEAGALYKRYKDPDVRRALEKEAGVFAGIDRGWNVVVWVPAPAMRPKVAQVLVNLNDRVAPLANVEEINDDVEATVDLHRKLWGAGIYVHPDIKSPSQRLAVAVWIKDHMGLNFLDEEGQTVPSLADFITNLLSEHHKIHGDPKHRLRSLVGTASAKNAAERSTVNFLKETDALRRAAQIGPDKALDPEWLIAEKGWRLQ